MPVQGSCFEVVCGWCQRRVAKVELVDEDGTTLLRNLWGRRYYRDGAATTKRELAPHRHATPLGRTSSTKPQYSQAWTCKCGKAHRARVDRLVALCVRAGRAGARSVVLGG